MKPVIKKHTHYNLLLMRDDSDARAFRMHSTVLRALIICLLLLAGGGAAGIYGGVHYWKKYRALAETHSSTERELSEIRLQLERLVNLESLIAASNNSSMLQTKNQEVGVPPLQTHLPPPAGTADVVADSQAANVSTQSPPASSPESGTAEDDAREAETLQPHSAQKQSADLETPSIETGPLRISDFTTRSIGPQRLHIQYDLSAAETDNQKIIAGNARYLAVFADNSIFELPVTETGKRFSITRMKSMQMQSRMPQEYKTADIAKVHVILELSEGRMYQAIFDAIK